jgi:hypothetical protein
MCDHIPENVTRCNFLSNGFGPVIVRIGFAPLGASPDVTLNVRGLHFLVTASNCQIVQG